MLRLSVKNHPFQLGRPSLFGYNLLTNSFQPLGKFEAHSPQLQSWFAEACYSLQTCCWKILHWHHRFLHGSIANFSMQKSSLENAKSPTAPFSARPRMIPEGHDVSISDHSCGKGAQPQLPLLTLPGPGPPMLVMSHARVYVRQNLA